MPTTVWVATANIYVGTGSSFTLGYTPGNRVPGSVVTSLGLTGSGLVESVTVEDDGTAPNWRGTELISRADLEEVLSDPDFLNLDADDIADGVTKVTMTASERASLAAVGSAITAAKDRANHTGTQTSATISDLREQVEDYVASLLGAGTNVSLTYTDNGAGAGTLSISTTGGTLDAEAARDAIGIAMVGVGLVSVAVNDAADTITISTTATANSTDAQLRDRSTHTGVEPISAMPAGTTLTAIKSGGTWPARPTSRTDVVVIWKGADPSPTIVASGTGGMLDGVDLRFVTP